jgi:hypothetical protein
MLSAAYFVTSNVSHLILYLSFSSFSFVFPNDLIPHAILLC